MFKHRQDQMEDYFNDGETNLTTNKSSMTRKNLQTVTNFYNMDKSGGDDDIYLMNADRRNKIYPDDSASQTPNTNMTGNNSSLRNSGELRT